MSRYSERLVVPWWWWPLGLALGGLLSASVSSGYGGLRGVLPYALGLPLVLVGLWWVGAARVGVGDGELRAGPAHIPVDLLGSVVVLDADDTRRALGPAGDPRAFRVVRPWVRRSVRVQVVDPEDETPYWLVSSRRPYDLATALVAERGVRP